jgi:citrate lyase subunit beta / citryl-CoA lyase
MKVDAMKQPTPVRSRRPTSLCRSWLFVPGAEREAHKAALESGADAILIEFEDFTPPQRREEARTLVADVFAAAKARNIVIGARINPLETEDGPKDLAAVMAAGPDIVAMPKVVTGSQVQVLGRAVTALGGENVELLPNVESARGLLNTCEIIAGDARVTACLVASEDMAADLGAERGQDGLELQYVRQNFLVQCVASGVLAIDCPYTWSDVAGVIRDTDYARRLGYRAKSIISPAHVAAVNAGLTPGDEAISQARELIEAFEHARNAGQAGVKVAGIFVEMPIYMNAKRLIKRAEALKTVEEL